MKQVLIQKGKIILEEVPAPALSENEVLVKTRYSLVSTGTELSGLAMSKEYLVTRALKQPQHLKKVLKMVKEKGPLTTYRMIKGMLDFGTPTGYSLAGEVIQVGANIIDIKKGDFVGCSGAGFANHAEFVAVPRLLVSKIMQGLDLREAASVTLGAIALQGVRQANPRLGEYICVIGLGLIGQLTVQILHASGVHVIGIDIDEKRCELAKKFGTKWILTKANQTEIQKITEGLGVDTTIITASSESNEPLRAAMEITRKKGTVVVVGAIGLQLERSPWYEKEIDLKISCSYGPGRYDPTYEEEMLDYPFPYVRWTENRNMEEYLKLLHEKKVNFLGLEPKEFSLEEAVQAYEYLREEKPLAILLSYGEKKAKEEKKIFLLGKRVEQKGKLGLAIIGAGSFAITTHLPNLAKLKNLYMLKAVVSKKGTTAKQYAKRYGAQYCTTDYEEVLRDRAIDAVLITTRHHLHAEQTLDALKAGKAVFVEKPLAISQEELQKIKNFYAESSSEKPLLMVGFNRRFSPFAEQIKKLTEPRRNPLLIHYRVNAGYLPTDHWTQKAREGGRIIGEACHFLDLFQFLTGSKPKKLDAQSLAHTTKDLLSQDNFFATITYEDGSVCNLLYTAIGPRDLPKEYVEIYSDGKVYLLDDYKKLIVKGGPGGMKSFFQDKGHKRELEIFAKSLKNGTWPIALDELFSVTELSFTINEKVTSM